VSDDQTEPCGSQRVTEVVEGHEYHIAWCPRVDGPCLFPGTAESKTSTRKCADSPGRRLAVTYSDDLVRSARDDLRERIEDRGHVLSNDSVHVAISAITACIGDES
jgi:hypothetical protein